MIARDNELAVIEAFLDRTAGGTRALILEGEAGIGKSTLWLAGVTAARERAYRVLASRPAETEGTLPNVVLGDLFDEVEPEALALLSAPRRRAFESALLLREVPDHPVDPRALGVAILTLLQGLGRRQRLVIAIDDEHWLDASSAATLRFALRRLADQPIRLLLSRRIGAASSTALEAAIDPSAVERVAVGALGVEEVQRLLRRQLGVTVPRPTLARIHEVSGGNPFYALELARVQSGEPARDATWPLTVPPGLERLVGARLNTLDEPTRRALLVVAAHGRLPVALARAMQLAPGPIERARAANVIEAEGGVIRFSHPCSPRRSTRRQPRTSGGTRTGDLRRSWTTRCIGPVTSRWALTCPTTTSPLRWSRQPARLAIAGSRSPPRIWQSTQCASHLPRPRTIAIAAPWRPRECTRQRARVAAHERSRRPLRPGRPPVGSAPNRWCCARSSSGRLWDCPCSSRHYRSPQGSRSSSRPSTVRWPKPDSSARYGASPGASGTRGQRCGSRSVSTTMASAPAHSGSSPCCGSPGAIRWHCRSRNRRTGSRRRWVTRGMPFGRSGRWRSC